MNLIECLWHQIIKNINQITNKTKYERKIKIKQQLIKIPSNNLPFSGISTRIKKGILRFHCIVFGIPFRRWNRNWADINLLFTLFYLLTHELRAFCAIWKPFKFTWMKSAHKTKKQRKITHAESVFNVNTRKRVKGTACNRNRSTNKPLFYYYYYSCNDF